MSFTSTADDLVEHSLDLNEYIIKQPAATYFMQVEGLSLKDIGIYPGDLITINRSLKAHTGSLVVATLHGDLVVNRYVEKSGRKWLVPENSALKKTRVDTIANFEIWGVVTHCIKDYIKGNDK